ncbi:MAG: tetratricopeptide repeat protein [Kiritimatiellia bacterium]
MSTTPLRFPFAIRKETGIAVFLFAATLALFWPARGFDYVKLDDWAYVVENPMVAGGLRGEAIREAFATVHEQWWLPLLWISYMADVELFGPGPHGHHLVNVLLHAANAALLFWALFRMTGSRWRSAFVAALFAWHPLRVESVAWITERKDVLCGLFFMLALVAHAWLAERTRPLRAAAVFACMLLGAMAKSIVVVLPVLLLLLDYWPLGRGGEPWGRGAWSRWRPLLAEKTGLWFLAAVFVWLTLATHGAGGEGVRDNSWLNRLTLVAPNYAVYLGKFVWPAQLTVVNSPDVPTPWGVRGVALAGLLAVTVGAWRIRKRWPYWAVGWLWFLAALLPVVRGIRFDEQSAFSDRYTYLPSVGIGLLLAWGAGEVADRWRRLKIPVVVAAALALAACAVLTRAQLPWWRDSMALFQRAIRLAPESPVVQESLGKALVDAGQYDPGLALLERALSRRPRRALDHNYIGVVLQKRGDVQAALDRFDEAVRLDPRRPDFHNNRGNARLALGREDEAMAAYREALRLDPGHADANYNLGGRLAKAGRWEEARACYETSARAMPNRAWTWYRLGLVCEKLGRFGEARACVERALQIDPRLPEAGLVLMRLDLMKVRNANGASL